MELVHAKFQLLAEDAGGTGRAVWHGACCRGSRPESEHARWAGWRSKIYDDAARDQHLCRIHFKAGGMGATTGGAG